MSMLPLLVISTENRLVRSSLPLPQDPCTGVADRSSAPAAPPAAPLVRPPAEKTATAVQPEPITRGAPASPGGNAGPVPGAYPDQPKALRPAPGFRPAPWRSEEHTSELQSR